jgi:hypothetical protein
MVPFDRGMDWDKAHAYARRIAQRMARIAPNIYTLIIDCCATAAAPPPPVPIHPAPRRASRSRHR